MADVSRRQWLESALAEIRTQFPNIPSQLHGIASQGVNDVLEGSAALDGLMLMSAGGQTQSVKAYFTNVLIVCLRSLAMDVGAHARNIRHQNHAAAPDAANDIVTDFNRMQREPRPPKD